MSAASASVSAKRSSAGETVLSPDFCQGSLATTSSSRSNPRPSTAARPAATWPACGGSNVPPRIPIRAPRSEPRSGAGKFCDDRREGIHFALVHHDVTEPVLLATFAESLDDLAGRPDQRHRCGAKLVRREAEGRRETFDDLGCVRDDRNG